MQLLEVPVAYNAHELTGNKKQKHGICVSRNCNGRHEAARTCVDVEKGVCSREAELE